MHEGSVDLSRSKILMVDDVPAHLDMLCQPLEATRKLSLPETARDLPTTVPRLAFRSALAAERLWVIVTPTAPRISLL